MKKEDVNKAQILSCRYRNDNWEVVTILDNKMYSINLDLDSDVSDESLLSSIHDELLKMEYIEDRVTDKPISRKHLKGVKVIKK